MKLFVLFALIASCSAFAPAASVRPAVARRSAMPVRQVAPVMELETVDTWCADALILPPEPRPDARDSQRSTQAGSEASVVLTSLLPASTGGETRTTRTRSCSASARTSRPRCSASPPALRSASASTASRRATCSTFSAAARCLPPPCPPSLLPSLHPARARTAEHRPRNASASRLLCSRAASASRAGQRLLRRGRSAGAVLVGPARGVLDPAAERQVSVARSRPSLCVGSCDHRQPSPSVVGRGAAKVRGACCGVYCFPVSLSPLCSGWRWPRSRVNVLS